MPDDRYRAALERQRKRIEEGLELTLGSSDAVGDKSNEATWGLCSDEKEAWPNPEDHLWPDQFIKDGRVAPKYLSKGQHCPFDDTTKRPDQVEFLGPGGCFYRCMLFQNKKADRPDRKRALELYDERIALANSK